MNDEHGSRDLWAGEHAQATREGGALEEAAIALLVEILARVPYGRGAVDPLARMGNLLLMERDGLLGRKMKLQALVLQIDQRWRALKAPVGPRREFLGDSLKAAIEGHLTEIEGIARALSVNRLATSLLAEYRCQADTLMVDRYFGVHP
jgi:hypothetical protein